MAFLYMAEKMGVILTGTALQVSPLPSMQSLH